MTDDARTPPTDATPPRLVDLAGLTLGRRLGQGGQGTVHEVLNKRINQSASGGGWPVVYKEYSPAVLPLLDRDALDACVRLLDGLSTEDGRWLCEKTAWPAALIGRQGHVCGFLMRAVPDRYWFTLRPLTAPGGPTGAGTASSGGTERLATMEFLLNDDAYTAAVGLNVSDRDRLLLLADLATTMARLHRFGVAVGDVSPKNLLFSLGTRPDCFLIDCDAMRVRGATALPQAETPDWQVPAGEERGTPAGDVHKLGLLAVRLFARDQTATDPAALAAISPALADLARASLGRDPALRPSPSLWAEQLTSTAATASSTPPKRPRPPKPPRPPQPGPLKPPGGRPAPGPGGPVAGAATPRPASSPSGRGAIGVLASIVVAVLLIALISSHQHSTDAGNATPGPTDAYSDTSIPDPTDTSTPPDPADSSTPPDPTDTSTPADPDPDTTAPDPGPPDPDPTTDTPAPEPATVVPTVVVPPPPPPPTYYYGAIAVAEDGSDGRSWDAGSQAAADQKALDECPRANCKILTRFVNGCGAVAYNPQTNMYWGGSGTSAGEAEDDAVANAGGGHWIVWACTTR